MPDIVLSFWKYHGAGNDFIMVDNRQTERAFSPETVRFLCHRHFGIGADGLIRIEKSKQFDFSMVYHNSDGPVGSMCGNGGRAAAAFAYTKGIVGRHCRFEAFDGVHEAFIEDIFKNTFHVKISMSDVQQVIEHGQDLLINTGSPHYIRKVNEVEGLDVVNQGRQIRYDKRISEDGVNVNFLQITGNKIMIRTYERGVENETLSCGTGVTAAAIANCYWNGITQCQIQTRGGMFEVSLEKKDGAYRNIFLEGPVQHVFSGVIEI